jgi:hypothetical protein
MLINRLFLMLRVIVTKKTVKVTLMKKKAVANYFLTKNRAI